jgi:uroporphyrinogen decarboxylase
MVSLFSGGVVSLTKRDRVIAAILKQPVDHVPSCFSMHFSPESANGEAAVKAHLDFLRATDVDVLKIMNENLVPPIGEMAGPEDWGRIPAYRRSTLFMSRQLDLVKRAIDEAGGEAYALATIHGVCASAIHPLEARYGYTRVREMQAEHFRQNKTAVLDAFHRIADAMSELAVACVEAGADGIYYAALGGEKHFFTDEEFAEAIEPFDRQILAAIRQAKGHTFLHICKENLNMNRYAGYGDLCDVVNWGVFEAPLSMEEGRRLFPNATLMGGLANHNGPLTEGPMEALEQAVRECIASVGERGFILGADCTLPTHTPYERIMAAVHAAIR